MKLANLNKKNSDVKHVDSLVKDSMILLYPNPDSIYVYGSITKIVYPINRQKSIDSLTEYFFDCDGGRLKIHIPYNYLRTDYFQYTEGQILSIHYSDSSIISILCGTLSDLAIEDRNANGLYDKKVIIKGHQITYSNVPEQRLKLFNASFRQLEKDLK